MVPYPSNSGPQSFLDERQDAIAAYTHALLWSVTPRRRSRCRIARLE
ncbi:hypothetical protein [Streptomyces sp. CG 926]|nr:hypothetical protein [Streptomyces sp. CG 926]